VKLFVIRHSTFGISRRRRRVVTIPAEARFRAARERRQARRRALWRGFAKRMHFARLGPAELVESNFPV
jgi:hypothetical protein